MVVFSHFASSFRLRIHPPSSFLARKSTPVWESVTDVVPKFGQARTPSWTIPSTIKARQTAYCSLRRKPRVPSIGSIVHDRPVGPPVCEPRSRAVSTLRDSGRAEIHRIEDVSRGQPFGSVRSRSDPSHHKTLPADTHLSSENDSPSPQIPSLSLPNFPFSKPSLTSPTTLFLSPSFLRNSVVSSSPTILSSGKAFWR